MIRKDLSHVFAYGSKNHVALVGKFEAEICCGNRQVLAWFHVSDSSNDSLLGYKTSSDLRIVKIHKINLVQGTGTEQIISNYSDHFEGLGNLNDGPSTLHHDSSMGETRDIVVYHSCCDLRLNKS